jgi:hypothetical protein
MVEHMYCPQCGTESSAGLQYCRSCGANLKVIAKAVTLSESIARSDRGLSYPYLPAVLPKIKEMMKNLKVEQVSEEISGALDQMNQEIVRSSPPSAAHKPWWMCLKEKTPAQRREKHLVNGTISLFSGIAVMIFLYHFCGALVLKLPPELLVKIPFELDPVVRILWLIGLIPALSGAGHIMAGLFIKTEPVRGIDQTSKFQQDIARKPTPLAVPGSITEHTTVLLDHEPTTTTTNELEN